MIFRTLRADELDQWVDHCFLVFTNDSKEYFLAHYRNDPWRDVNGIFVAEDGGRIVSTVRVFRRKVWLFGGEVPMGGIGEVSTNPAYRGQGLAGTLLRMAARWMAQEGMPVSLLFSGSHDFYRRFGWECLPKPMRKFAAAPGLPCEGRAMRPEDMDALRQVDAASEKTNWMVVRMDPEYWKLWMPEALGKCAVATEGGAVVAWLAYHLHDDDWSMTEFSALPGFEHKLDGLCALTAELEGRRGQPYYAPAWLPAGAPGTETVNLMYSMVRLNAPFNAGGRAIGSTEQLIAETRECRDSGLDHF